MFKSKQFWGGIVGLALLAFCLKDIRPSTLDELWVRVQPIYLLPALGFSVLYQVFRTFRWRLLVSQQLPLRHRAALPIYGVCSFFSVAMPALTGQVGKLIFLSRRLQLRKSFIFSTMFMEILFDAVSLVFFIILTSAAFVFPSEYRGIGVIVSIVTFSVLVIMYLLLHFREQVTATCRALLRNRWPSVYIVIRRFLHSFTKGLYLLTHARNLFGTMSYSLLSWLAHLLVIYSLFHAFGFHLPVVATSVVMIVNSIVLMIPVAPGNAGTFEFAVSRSLGLFSIPTSDGVLFALCLHLVDFFPIILFGSMYLRAQRLPLAEIMQEAKRQTAEGPDTGQHPSPDSKA